MSLQIAASSVGMAFLPDAAPLDKESSMALNVVNGVQRVTLATPVAEVAVDAFLAHSGYHESKFRERATDGVAYLSGRTVAKTREYTLDKAIKGKIHSFNNTLVEKHFHHVKNGATSLLSLVPKDERVDAAVSLFSAAAALVGFDPEKKAKEKLSAGLNSLTDYLYDEAMKRVAEKISSLAEEPMRSTFESIADGCVRSLCLIPTEKFITAIAASVINEVSERTYGEPVSETLTTTLNYTIYGLTSIRLLGYGYQIYQLRQRVKRLTNDVRDGIEKELIEASGRHFVTSIVPEELRVEAIKAVRSSICPRIEELVKQHLSRG